MGYIYIMENPAFPNLIKIGYADDVKQRLAQFETGVPDSYHVYAIYETKAKRLSDKDFHKVIDAINPNIRYDKSKEFYELSAEQAYNILMSIAKINGLENALTLNPYNDVYFKKRLENMTSYGRPKVPARVSFEKLNIPIGATLTFNIDPNITVTVIDTNNKVKYNNKVGSVSDIATIIRKELNKPYKSINGWIEFSYNGISLGTLRNQYWIAKGWENN